MEPSNLDQIRSASNSGIDRPQAGSKALVAVVSASSASTYRDIPKGPQLARVAALANDGKATLLVNGRLIFVDLPAGAKLKVGQDLSVLLKVLNQPNAGAVRSATSGNFPDSTLRLLGQESSSTKLSPTGALLGALAKRASNTDPVFLVASETLNAARAQITAAVSAGALTGNVHSNLVDSLVEFLFSGMDKSGLFYESHLKDWVLGKRNTQQIRDESRMAMAKSSQLDENAFAQHRLSHPTEDMPQGKVSENVAKQLASLFQNSVGFNIQGLFGSPVEIFIEKNNQEERRSKNQGRGDWSLSITTDLPCGQILRLDLMMSNASISGKIIGPVEITDRLSSVVPVLTDRLSARGLHLAKIEFVGKQDG